MKKILIILPLFAILSCGNPNEITQNFHVYGNCMMCENTIEESLKEVDGVTLADWDKKTKQMTVTFDSSKLNLEEIKLKIAGVGYDTEEFRAEDQVYNDLHKCCKYTRPE